MRGIGTCDNPDLDICRNPTERFPPTRPSKNLTAPVNRRSENVRDDHKISLASADGTRIRMRSALMDFAGSPDFSSDKEPDS
jgi:hypothetical protein